jgi:hypothetical protein
MVNKYTLGGVVFGIFLLAIMGIRSATNWLTQSDASTTQQDSVLSTNNNRITGDSAYRSSTQAPNSQVSSQSNGSTQLAQNGSPLDEAGSYIQRQKRVGEDGAITNTEVSVTPTTGKSPVSAVPNTTVTPQPTSPAPSATTAPKPVTQAPAVPALW